MQVHAEEAPGDVLVFLTGQDEIESLARLVNARCALCTCSGATLRTYLHGSSDTRVVAVLGTLAGILAALEAHSIRIFHISIQ